MNVNQNLCMIVSDKRICYAKLPSKRDTKTRQLRQEQGIGNSCEEQFSVNRVVRALFVR